MPLKYRSTSILGTEFYNGSYYDIIDGSVVQIDYTSEPESHPALSSWDSLDLSVSSDGVKDNPFAASHLKVTGSTIYTDLDKTHEIGPVYVNKPSTLYSGYYSYANGSDIINLEDLMLQLLGRSNPTTPAISIPNFLWELKDLPDMLRQLGRILIRIRERRSWKDLIRPESTPRDLATANVAIQFGWRPLFGDVNKIVQLNNSLSKRGTSRQATASPRGSRVRVSLGDVSDTRTEGLVLHSTGGLYIDVPVTITTRIRTWGVARWKSHDSSDTNALQGGPDDFRRILGLTPDQILPVLWEALPWSWLLDYFTNIGNILKAGNFSECTPISGCIMRESITTATHDSWHSWKDSCSAGKSVYTERRRMTMSQLSLNPVLYLARVPCITGPQLSILGSLALLRAK